ncbi:hypothetical protein TWF718_006701 [Orbilia javanica]|uniref:Uncharacterized protein n=1 Tax=Orbilia javanica TaxID=47235 RepID=A0AAN8N1K5_9PEZI
MIINDEEIGDLWSIYYDFLIPNKCSITLKDYIERLLRSAHDIDSWSSSGFGGVLRIGSVKTLIAVKRVWEVWRSDLGDKSYKTEILNTHNRWRGGILNEWSTIGQAPLPHLASVLNQHLHRPYKKHFYAYWESGTTEKSHRHSLAPNPTLSSSQQTSRFRVEKATYPPSGFHTTTAIVPFALGDASCPDFRPIAASEDFGLLVHSVKEEFSLWCQSFKSTQSAGLFTASFFVDDAFELCSGLSQFPSSPSPDIIGSSELNEGMIATKGYVFNHPTRFNVIDTSNLMDHLGILNLLLSTAPLLRRDQNSYLNTEAFDIRQFNPHLKDQNLLEAFSTDPASLFALIGLAPIDFVCGLDTTSQDADNFEDRFHLRSRNVWKWIPQFHPEGVQGEGIEAPVQFEYDISAMSAFLATLYIGNFTQKGPYYSDATFSLLLQQLKRITSPSVDWEQLIDGILISIACFNHTTTERAFNHEQYTLNHLFGVHTAHALRLAPTPKSVELVNSLGYHPAQRYADKAKEIAHRISPQELLLCLTLSVPAEAFRKLIEKKKSEIGTPPFQLSVSYCGSSHTFRAIRRRIGWLNPPAVQNIEDVKIEEGSPLIVEDPEGWRGKSDVIFSCMVPAWMAMLPDCTVSLEFTPAPYLPNKTAILFESDIHNYYNIRLSTKFPLSVSTGQHRSAEGGLQGHGIKYTSDGANKIDGMDELRGHDETSEVKNIQKIVFSETENKIESIVRVNSPSPGFTLKNYFSKNPGQTDMLLYTRKDPPIYVQFPVGISYARSRSVSSWNLHRINLDKSPPVLIDLPNYGNKGYEWVNDTFKPVFTEKELQYSRGTLANDALCISKTLAGVKSTIYRMIIGHTGICQTQSSSYLLQHPRDGGFMLVYIKDLRLDLSGHSIVADCGLVPLEESLATAPLPTKIENLSEIEVSEEETSAWMQLSVGLVERCRTWSHKSSCEYFQQGRIPLSAPKLTFGVSPLCGCGKGEFPKAFRNDPIFKPWAPYATRAAISPLYPPRLSQRLNAVPQGFAMLENLAKNFRLLHRL